MNNSTNQSEWINTKVWKDLVMNVTIPDETNNNIEWLIIFFYEAIDFPTESTLIGAINKRYFVTWSGLTAKRVNKYIKSNIINTKKHMHIQRQKQYEKSTLQKNISLYRNRLTNRKLTLDGFLQAVYSVWDSKQQKMLEFNNLVKDPATQIIWTTSLANELGRLALGIRNIKGSNCIKFICKHQVPKDCMAT